MFASGNWVVDDHGPVIDAGPGAAVDDHAPAVDWAEVERRGRRAGLLLPTLVIALGASRVLLTGDYAGLHGTAALWLLLAVVVLVLAAPLAAALVPWLRARHDVAARVQYALRTHVDPGPGLRSRVDALARRSLRLAWMRRALPVLPLSVLLQAEWDRPSSLPAATVLVAAYVALAVWHHRQLVAARRWTVAPAGPPRAFPPIPWWEPWLGGRRLLALAGAYVLVVVLVLAL
ncbi:hypothetical protein [Blastococcus brunescens]|uniref:Sensor domain-containing protein n=1 Tax=Blastococcus brunescens TaxID=1564165 RepID=A0ABZ1B7Z4_9ACTN|nr:hypothetical protein [Blastococcus sp. BMG 8361]WRL66231.1 hypothetical protein U6N30_12600 [Blastococcus sp. BMG 8361]